MPGFKKAFSFLLLTAAAASAVAKDDFQTRCNKVLNNLPSQYMANFQINLNAEPQGREDEPIVQSINVIESDNPLWGKTSIVVSSVENDGESDAGILIRDKYIWNSELMGEDNLTFLHVEEYHDQDPPKLSCMANAWSSNFFLEVILGLFEGSYTGRPTIQNMLHFGPDGGYDCMGEYDVYGVPTLMFQKSVKHPDTEESFFITHYWQDPALDGSHFYYSKPVATYIEGQAYVEPEHWDFKAYISYHEFVDRTPSIDEFYPPPDVTCHGREEGKKLDVQIDNTFSFTSETVYTLANMEDGSLTEHVTPRQEWYDSFYQVSKVIYKKKEMGPRSQGPPPTTPFVSEIRDFTSRLLYSTDLSDYSCKVGVITTETDSEVVHNDDGSIAMPNTFFYFKLDLPYVDNGQEASSRGFDILYEENHAEEEGRMVTTVLGFSSSYVDLPDDEGNAQRIVPVYLETYPTDDFSKPGYVVRQNIFGFDDSTPAEDFFDITNCFPEDNQTDHRQIVFSVGKEYAQAFRTYEGTNAIRMGIALAGKVQLMRVQNIQVDYNVDDSNMFVLYTVVEFPRSRLGDMEYESIQPLSPPVTIALADVVFNVQDAVNAGSLNVIFKGVDDGKDLTIKATPGFYRKVTSRGSDSHGNKYSVVSDGYSGGAMAGLAFGMILLGVLVAGVTYHFFFRNSARYSIPTPRSFANPLSV